MKRMLIMALFAAGVCFCAARAEESQIPLTIAEILNPEVREAVASFSPNYDYIPREHQIYAYTYAVGDTAPDALSSPVFTRETDPYLVPAAPLTIERDRSFENPVFPESYVYTGEYPFGHAYDGYTHDRRPNRNWDNRGNWDRNWRETRYHSIPGRGHSPSFGGVVPIPHRGPSHSYHSAPNRFGGRVPHGGRR